MSWFALPCHFDQREKSLPSRTQVFPVWVHPVHQLILLLSSPFLYFFFSGNSSSYVLRFFKINQLVHVVFFGKSFDELVLVLIKAPLQIIGYPQIHHFIVPICEQIHIICHSHGHLRFLPSVEMTIWAWTLTKIAMPRVNFFKRPIALSLLINNQSKFPVPSTHCRCLYSWRVTLVIYIVMIALAMIDVISNYERDRLLDHRVHIFLTPLDILDPCRVVFLNRPKKQFPISFPKLNANG